MCAANNASDVSDYAFLYNLTTTPCFRKSALLGLGGGAAIATLQLRQSKRPMHAAELMVKSGCAIALLSWAICRKRFYDERELTYATMQRAQLAAISRPNKPTP